MQRLATLTNWQLKREIVTVKGELEQLSGGLNKLQHDIAVLDDGILAASALVKQLNLLHSDNKLGAIKRRVEKYRGELSELRDEEARLRKFTQSCEASKDKLELACKIVQAETRMKQLQAELPQHSVITLQAPLIEEMSALNELTRRKKEVNHLIPYKTSPEEIGRKFEIAVENHNRAQKLQRECLAEIQRLNAELKACQEEFLAAVHAQEESQTGEYLSAKNSKTELLASRDSAQFEKDKEAAKYADRQQYLQDAEVLLAKRLRSCHPEHEAYHDALQELQHTLKQKPERASELTNALYQNGQLFLGGVLSSEKLPKAEKTRLLIAANELIKQPQNTKCIRHFNAVLQVNQEKISILTAVAGAALIAGATLIILASLMLGMTGFGVPLMSAGVVLGGIVGLIGVGVINRAYNSQVSDSGHQLLTNTKSCLYFYEQNNKTNINKNLKGLSL